MELRSIARLGRGVWLVLAFVPVALGASCSEKPSFEVGDCVHIDQTVVDPDLEAADCGDAVGTFDASERTYRVDEIIENTNGGCPQLQGFVLPVEFIHEPDGVTYCLVQQD